MRPQTLIIVVLALVFGGIAAGGVMLLSKNQSSQGAERSTMVLASADVPRGESLTAASLVVKEFPATAVLPGVITRIEDALDRSTLTPLYKGELLLETKLAAKGAGRGLASLIKKGMRAVTIPTPNVGAGVAGFIVPGSRVDVHWISNEPRARDDHTAGQIAPPLLENVEVLAVDDKIDVPAANRTEGAQMKSVTVQVQPAEADKLTPALSKGTIHLSLRNPGDEGLAPPRPVAVAPVAPEPPPRPRVIRIFKGSRVSVHHLGGSADLFSNAK
jgi:pilus assembly protein CpaB